MNKKTLIGLLMILIALVAGYFILQTTKKQTPIATKFNQDVGTSQNQYTDTTLTNNATASVINTKTAPAPAPTPNSDTDSKQKSTVASNWKTYTNSRLGITFQYPDTWTKYGEDANVIDRTGEVVGINVNFIDTNTQSIFYLAYNLAPYGAELYKDEIARFNSSKGTNKREEKQIAVAGNKAIEYFTTMSKDIKGNIYNPPLRFVHVIFSDKQQTGGFNLNFRTLLPNSDTEIAKFHQLLSTIKFVN